MILWQSQSTWETNPKPSTRLWVERWVTTLTCNCTAVGQFMPECTCVHVHSAGAETELMLWGHVMLLPFLRGHTSLCLSAFPTTPIIHQSPALNTQNGHCLICSGARRWEGGSWWQVSPTFVNLDWWELKEWLGLVRGRRINIWNIFKLSKRWTSLWCFNTSWKHTSVT